MRPSMCRNLIRNPIISKSPLVHIPCKRKSLKIFDLTMGTNEHPESDSLNSTLSFHPLFSIYIENLFMYQDTTLPSPRSITSERSLSLNSLSLPLLNSSCDMLKSRGGKIGPTQWASPVRPKLGPGWAIKFLARKKPGQIWPGPVWPSPVWPGPARPARIFFCLEKTIWPDRPGF